MLQRKQALLKEAVLRLPRPHEMLAQRRRSLRLAAQSLGPALRDRTQQARVRLMERSRGLDLRALGVRIERGKERLGIAGSRLRPGLDRAVSRDRDRLQALGQTLGVFSYQRTLERGFAVLRDADGKLLARAAAIAPGDALEIELVDARVGAHADREDATGSRPQLKRSAGRKPPKSQDGDSGQGSLF